MGFNDNGFDKLGSIYITGSFAIPTYVEFGTGSSSFNGSTYYLDNGIMRKQGTWSIVKGDPRITVSLTNLEMVGSNILEIGIGSSSSVGSDLYTRDNSAIGTKTNEFDVQWRAKIRHRRLV